MRNVLKTIRPKLVELSTNVVSDPKSNFGNNDTYAICRTLILWADRFHHTLECNWCMFWLKEQFSTWDQFSGDISFPVPHDTLSPHDAFRYKLKWDNDAYGDARRALCVHLIKCIDRDLANES